jgi:hypothetical protein
MVCGMPWTEEGAQGRAFCLKFLPITYREPVIVRVIFVDFRVWIVLEEVGDALYVIVVPMRQ